MRQIDSLLGRALYEGRVCLRLAYYDLLFLFRHGFFAAYGVILLAYIGFFTLLPDSIFREGAVIFAVYSDTAVVGFYFSAAMVFLEKDQKLHAVWNVLPVYSIHYVIGKILSFAAASLVVSFILYIPYFGINHLGGFAAGVLLSVVLYIPLALILSLKVSTLLDFLLLSAGILTPALLPVAEIFFTIPLYIGKIFPGYGILMLLSAGTSEELLAFAPYHLLSPLLCAVLLIFIRSRMRAGDQ